MSRGRPRVFAVKHKSPDVRASSRSGGVFTAFSDEVLNNGGVVYGCILNDRFEAVHVRAVTKKERNRMRGSKYVQSSMGDIFREVRADLEEEKEVLFSGTSCQVAGLKSYLGKPYRNLICVDIICLGVPSPLVWQKYLQWQEQRAGAQVISCNFRNKKDYGWASHVESLRFANGKESDSQVFATLFYGYKILRPSCYECPYKDVMHPGEITIADYWGVEKAVSGFDDNKGVSLVLLNGETGDILFEKVKQKLVYYETKLEDSMQPVLSAPTKRPDSRDEFWKDFGGKPFAYIVKKYGRYGFRNELQMYLGGRKRQWRKVIAGKLRNRK